MKRLSLLFTLIFILSACVNNEASLTLEANHGLAGTSLADLRVTASVQAARAETTLDFMGTRSSLAATQSIFLEETLIATGFAPDRLATQRQLSLGSSPTPLPTFTPLPESTENINPVSSTLALSPTPGAPPVTINAPRSPVPTATSLIEPTPDFGGLLRGNLLTATGAGDNGCGTGVTSIFGMDVSEIYVILPVFNITANSYTFAARWQRDGQPVGPVYDFTPDFDADELCIWFFVDESDFEFLPGNYTVTIDINGQIGAGPIPFIIQ